MKEIKTKPEGGKPRLLESAAKAPKTAMKDVWLKSKEKAVSEFKETPFANQQGETSNAPVNSAGDQMLSGIETTAKKGADLTYRGGKKLVQTTARKVREKREISRTLKEAESAGSQTGEAVQNASSKIRTKNAAVKGVKGKPQKAVKTASRSMKSVKNGTKGIKTAQRSAKTAQQTAKATAKDAQKAAQAARTAARATVTGIQAAARVTVAAVKATIAAVKGLIAAIAAGGWIAVVIILLICLIALIVGSCFGLFFGSDSTGTGTSVTQAVTTLNGEFQAHIQEIENTTAHDRQEITSNDGVLSINWEDVLAVFSAKVTGAENGSQVASLDDAQVDELRNIMWEMNAVTSSTLTESHEIEITEVGEDGKETTRTETVTETILEITITHKTAEDGPSVQLQRPAKRIPCLNVGTGKPEPVGRTAGRLCWRRRGNFRPQYRLGRNRHLPVAASGKFYDYLMLRLPGGPLHRGNFLPQRNRYRRSGWNAHPCGCGRHRHHRQRHRFVGRWVWIPYQAQPQRYLRHPVCPLFLYLRNRGAGSEAGRSDRLCRYHRQLYRKPSAF